MALHQALGRVQREVHLADLRQAAYHGDRALETPLQQLRREGFLLVLDLDTGGGGKELGGTQLGQLSAHLWHRYRLPLRQDGGGDGSGSWAHPAAFVYNFTSCHGSVKPWHGLRLHVLLLLLLLLVALGLHVAAQIIHPNFTEFEFLLDRWRRGVDRAHRAPQQRRAAVGQLGAAAAVVRARRGARLRSGRAASGYSNFEAGFILGDEHRLEPFGRSMLSLEQIFDSMTLFLHVLYVVIKIKKTYYYLKDLILIDGTPILSYLILINGLKLPCPD